MADDMTFQSATPSTVPDTTVIATDDVGSKHYQRVKLVMGDDGTVDGDVKSVDQKMRVSSMPYLFDIAEGNVANDVPFISTGYAPAITTTEEVIWSGDGTYTFPTAEMGMELVSNDNTNDIGTVIKGDATGNTVQADADGTTTLLEDDSVDFTAATAVAAGDCVILDPHGAVPEYGFVTAVAANTLTVAGGFTSGGTAASRYYAVIDKSAYTNAMAVGIQYLDGDYVSHNEIVVLNGTTAVATINEDMFRINRFIVIFAGSNEKALGHIELRHLSDTPVYGHITAGYTIGRALIYTVPADYTLYITGGSASASNPNDTKVQTARVILRTNSNPFRSFPTGNMFYPILEFTVSNELATRPFEMPLKVVEKTDIVMSGQGFTGFSGPITAIITGWMESND